MFQVRILRRRFRLGATLRRPGRARAQGRSWPGGSHAARRMCASLTRRSAAAPGALTRPFSVDRDARSRLSHRSRRPSALTVQYSESHGHCCQAYQSVAPGVRGRADTPVQGSQTDRDCDRHRLVTRSRRPPRRLPRLRRASQVQPPP